MALAEYNDLYWFPSGEPARNTPARIFPEHSNTFAQLYADEAGTQPLPNPLTTDNDGRLRFWAEAGFYWISIDQESIRVAIGTGEEGVTPQQVDEKIAAHNADTTAVHGIPDTSQLLTHADLPDLSGYATDAELAAHVDATTGVHGIADTSVLETQGGAQAKADQARDQAVQTAAADATGQLNEARGELEEAITAGDQAQAQALAAHTGATTNVHGIPDTSTIPTNAQFLQVQDALALHESDTTDVHGIPDTSQLATDADVAAVGSQLADHVADTTGVHGIGDTSQLLTSADLEEYVTDGELAAHTSATTNVHGIPDTGDLVTGADLAGLATDAEVAAATGQVQAALDTHAADTTAVHGIPDTSQLATHADLDGLAPQAELDAHVGATTNVHGIPDTAALLTQADMSMYATDTELAAHAADTTAVHGIADTAALETKTGAQAKADAAQTTAIDMAAGLLTEHEADTTNVHGIPDTSQLVTQADLPDLSGYATDADLAAHEADTTAVHGIADTSALETQAGAQAKANTAQTNATTAAATALAAHEADTTAVHGIADTAALETQTGAQAKATAAQNAATTAAATALAAHEADTTAVHGIADTSVLETQAGAQAKATAAQNAAATALAAHEADTTAVHGIADTSVLETQAGAQAKANTAQTNATTAAATALAAHEADTTAVHGITDTAALETKTGAQTKADAARDAAIADAATRYLNRTTGGTVTGDLNITGALAVTGTSTLSGLLQLARASASAVGLGSQVTGEGFDRFRISASGAMEWGSGSAARDCFFAREGTGALTATDTLLRVYRASASNNAFSARVTGDTTSRWYVNVDGAQWWSTGSGAADVGLWRSAASQLTTNGALQTSRTAATDAARDLRLTTDTQPRFYQVISGQMYWGSGAATLDTTLYRDQPGSLVTDGDFTVNGNLWASAVRYGGRLLSNLDVALRPTGVYETDTRLAYGTASTYTSGQLVLVPIWLPAGVAVSQISFASGGTAGASLTNQWFMLLNSSRVALARTADATTAAWAANTVKTLAIAQTTAGASATSYTTTYTGLHYLGLMIAGTTMPSLISQGNVIAVNLISPAFGVANTGMTTPPTITSGAFTATAPSGTGYSYYGSVTAS
ncbi:hypothetical protein [Streptomyces longwoodensis]|uniref:hypothetical protein n=1 Tax=Streptomyces longwoodensis TaxID=68231 RepID=UPI0036FE4B58